jgi:hypothetical protein
MLMVASLVACGSPAPPAPHVPVTHVDPAPAPDGPVSLKFRMFAGEGSARRALAAGERMHSGDRLTMTLTVDRPAYGYVLQFFPDGTSTVLFPRDAEDNRITGTMAVPPSGAFELDDVVGEETVYVVVSTRPLAEVDAAVQAAVEQIRTTNAPGAAEATAPPVAPATVPSEPPRKPEPAPGNSPRHVGKHGGAGAGAVATKPATGAPVPGRASLGTRGLVRVNAAEVAARTDEHGLAIFNVSFQHVKRD